MKILLISIAFSFLSCATPNYQKYLDNDVNYYHVNPKDTILDLGYDEHIAAPLLSTQIDSLHFYFLVSAIKGQKVERFLSSSQTNNFLFGTRRYSTASEVKIIRNDSIALSSNSVNKIIFRNYLWFFHKGDIIKELKRVLKEDGTLIIVQEEINFSEKSFRKHGIPFPRENDVVRYYEEHGFVKTIAVRGIKSPYRERFTQFQLHFKKRS